MSGFAPGADERFVVGYGRICDGGFAPGGGPWDVALIGVGALA